MHQAPEENIFPEDNELIEESNVEIHLKNKCEFVEEELEKEKLINKKNTSLIETQLKTIDGLKKEVDSANKRTQTENQKISEKDDDEGENE